MHAPQRAANCNTQLGCERALGGAPWRRDPVRDVELEGGERGEAREGGEEGEALMGVCVFLPARVQTVHI